MPGYLPDGLEHFLIPYAFFPEQFHQSFAHALVFVSIGKHFLNGADCIPFAMNK
jgi:hypothetical protein